MFRIAIYSRSITAAKVPIFWPKPDINNVLPDVKDGGCFPIFEIGIGYWVIPMYRRIQPLHAILSPKRMVHSIPTAEEVINSAANF